MHRKHHAAVDTPEDPHSPAQLGFWRVQLGNVGLYKRAAADEENLRKYARDIPHDNLDRMFFDHAVAGLALGITMLVVGMWVLGYGITTGFVAAGHARGLLRDARGRDQCGRPRVRQAAVSQLGHELCSRSRSITGGEGLHNNHHAAPTSARFSLAPGQLDPGWWLVRTLVAFHLADVRHSEVHFTSTSA